MKIKILLFLSLLIIGNVFAQFPSTGLVRAYDFTNGSFNDLVASENFVQTGTAATLVTDRSTLTNNAYSLNGDYFSANDIDYGVTGANNNTQVTTSLSFWIRTTTNNTQIETIIDESQRATEATWYGYYIYLENGKIKVDGRYQLQRFYPATVYTHKAFSAESNSVIADGNWHHIVISMQLERAFQYTYSNEFTTQIYVNSILEDTGYNSDSGYFATPISHDAAVDFTIGNRFTGDLTATNVYKDEIDDVLVYNRLLTTAEIQTLRNNTEICIRPDSSVLSTSAITETSATIDISGSETYDIAYHKTSEAFTNATIVTGITSGSTNLSALDNNTSYDVYVRKQCANPSDWSDAISFTTEKSYIEIYVNINATGANDGTSWADAFTSVNDAIAVAYTSAHQIWVAAGTYIPTSGTGRNAAFSIYRTFEMYGGFDGTETHVSQRDPKTNITILSGDIDGDDSATITDADTSRQDNSYHVVKLIGSFAAGGIIDGFTISGGNANGGSDNNCSTTAASQYFHSRAGAIYVNPNAANASISMKFNNCVIEKNSATGMAVYWTYSPCGIQNTTTDIDFANTIIRDNYSVDYSAIFYGGSNTYNNFRYGSLVNSLVYDNYCLNEASVLTLSSSGGTTSSNVDVINSTITQNTSGIYKAIKMTNASNSSIENSIIYDNGSISSILNTAGTQASVANCIIEGGQLSSDASDPLFTNVANDDFTLQASSPARDSGDNSYVPASMTEDLAGNARIYNTTVDIGAYENNDPIITYVLILAGTNGTVTVDVQPNNGTYTDGTAVELTATPATGYQFDGWSGDASGTTNPLSITMDADKSVTAVFSLIQQTLTTTALNGTITADVQPTNGTYDYGTVVELTATPNAGYQFDGWSGDASGSTNPLSITTDASKSVTATFSLIQQTLTTTAVNGTISLDIQPTNGTYDYGTVVELTPTPATGYQFDGWSGDASGTTNPLSITMDADKNITALFSVVQYTVTYTAVNGTISANIQPVNGTYDVGTLLELTATPNPGYKFDGWGGDLTGLVSNSASTYINSDRSFIAFFSPIQQTLTTTAVNGAISLDIQPTNGTYDYGTVVELTATPDTGYQFDGWSGDVSGTTNPLSITMDADKNVTALFSLIPTASVVDNEFNSAISVYPNPVVNTLKVDLASGQELKSLQVFNLIGKKVFQTKTNTIDFSTISSGIYLLKVENTKGKIAIRKVIKE